MGELNLVYARIAFKEYLEASGYKANTIKAKLYYLGIFVDYLKKTDDETDLRGITGDKLLEFLVYVEKLKKIRTGKQLGKRTREMIFRAIKQLFFSLYEQGLILHNPCERIKYKAKGEIKRRIIMKKEEISWFLDRLTENRRLGVKDRAMFELLYATGIRASELVRLKVEDVNFTERLLLVRRGKWEKDRVVPVSDVALKFLGVYLKQRWARGSDPIFLNSSGKNERMSISSLNRRFKLLLKEFGMYKKGLCIQSIRHSVSVHLLANGADIRYVQAFLGHESIETTVGYTHELHENIKKIHRQYHPRENEYIRKVDAAYLADLEKFYQKVKKVKERNRRLREVKGGMQPGKRSKKRGAKK